MITKLNTRIYDLDGDFEAVFSQPGWIIKMEEAKKVQRCGRGYSENYQENREKTIKKAKTRLRRFITRYKLNRFATLTFKENIQDVKIADHEFRIFIKRLRRKNKDFIYVAVREFQQRGAVHYHLAINTYIDHKELSQLWGHGYVWIEKKTNDYSKMASYIVKYITKYADDERLQGFNLYLKSHGLDLPKEDLFFTSIDDLLDHLVLNFPEQMPNKRKMYFEENRLTWIG